MSSLNNPQSPANNIQLPTFPPPPPPPPPIHQQSHPVPPNATPIRRSHTHPLTRALQLSVIPTTSHSTGRPTETRYLYLDRQCNAMRCDPIQSVQRTTLSKDPVEVRAGTLWKTRSSACYAASVGRSYSIYTCADGLVGWLVGWLVGCHDPSQKNKWIKGRNPPNVKNDVATLPIATSRTC